MRAMTDIMHLHVSHTCVIWGLLVFYFYFVLLVPWKLPLSVSLPFPKLDKATQHGEEDKQQVKEDLQGESGDPGDWIRRFLRLEDCSRWVQLTATNTQQLAALCFMRNLLFLKINWSALCRLSKSLIHSWIPSWQHKSEANKAEMLSFAFSGHCTLSG